MQRLTNEQKADLYNKLLFQYQRIHEEIREIKARNFEVSEQDQKKITYLEQIAKKIYDDTRRLY